MDAVCCPLGPPRPGTSAVPGACARGECGQVVPLLALAVVVAFVAAGWVGHLGHAAVQRAQAGAAADAAALAAASAGPPAAEELARANGAGAWTVRRDGNRFSVTATVGEARDESHALRVDPPPITGTGTRAGLAPAMLAALARADQLLGYPVPISSGYRDPAHQRRLWERRATNPYPVARPGTSLHERGLAVDVPRAFVARLLSVAARAGLCQPLPRTDPVHFELCDR